MIIIGGATASGKSSMAVELAKAVNGEIVSADSMQIYRNMDIGTAKITTEEMQGITHHMLNIVDPCDAYTVATYADVAKNIIKDIKKSGKTPIVVGGTGLYINSLIYEYQFSAQNNQLKDELQKELDLQGKEFMYDKLLSLDPQSGNFIHKNNTKRVLRAIEVFLTTGESIVNKHDKLKCNDHIMFALDINRDTLYSRIDERVNFMFGCGILSEVEGLIERYNLTFDNQSMQGIGYKEFKSYFSGENNLMETKEIIKQHTRNYAKRQITWFKSIPSCEWLNYDDKNILLEQILEKYYKKYTNL